MPIKTSETTRSAGAACFMDSAQAERLAAELSRVEALLRDKSAAPCPAEGSAALIRLISGLSAPEWERFVGTHGFENWIHVALGNDSDDIVGRFLSSYEHLSFQRNHDALTGLGNRRLFDEKLSAEFERAVRSYNELSLLFIDLDDFKKLNDTYGHACGDEVLQRLGATMLSSLRPYDISCRIGGEEFSVILPATSSWTGVGLGNRLLERFRQETFSCGGDTFSVTFSCGVSSLAQLPEENSTPATLLQQADKALYEAKHNGKSQVILAESARAFKDKKSLVHAEEKRLLFSHDTSE